MPTYTTLSPAASSAIHKVKIYLETMESDVSRSKAHGDLAAELEAKSRLHMACGLVYGQVGLLLRANTKPAV